MCKKVWVKLILFVGLLNYSASIQARESCFNIQDLTETFRIIRQTSRDKIDLAFVSERLNVPLRQIDCDKFESGCKELVFDEGCSEISCYCSIVFSFERGRTSGKLRSIQLFFPSNDLTGVIQNTEQIIGSLMPIIQTYAWENKLDSHESSNFRRINRMYSWKEPKYETRITDGTASYDSTEQIAAQVDIYYSPEFKFWIMSIFVDIAGKD